MVRVGHRDQWQARSRESAPVAIPAAVKDGPDSGEARTGTHPRRHDTGTGMRVRPHTGQGRGVRPLGNTLCHKPVSLRVYGTALPSSRLLGLPGLGQAAATRARGARAGRRAPSSNTSVAARPAAAQPTTTAAQCAPREGAWA